MFNPLRDANVPKVKLKDVKLSRIFNLFRPYRLQLALILILALASASVGIGPPLVMKEIIDHALPQADKACYGLWSVGWLLCLKD
jgi:ATP-binding cassette subfamily B protein